MTNGKAAGPDKFIYWGMEGTRGERYKMTHEVVQQDNEV